VGELGSRMVAEEWSMSKKALVMERRVTRRELMTFAGFLKIALLWN